MPPYQQFARASQSVSGPTESGSYTDGEGCDLLSMVVRLPQSFHSLARILFVDGIEDMLQMIDTFPNAEWSVLGSYRSLCVCGV